MLERGVCLSVSGNSDRRHIETAIGSATVGRRLRQQTEVADCDTATGVWYVDLSLCLSVCLSASGKITALFIGFGYLPERRL